MNQRLVDVFCEMVRMGSESGNEGEFLAYLKDLFTRDLNATCSFDAYGNLLARVPARNCAGVPPILLGCHGDTVKPGEGIEPIVVDGVIRSKGDTILGADDKAGIAEIYEAVLSADRHPELEIVVTREEEIGLVGASHVDESVLKAKMGFILDGDNLNSIVVGGPSHMLIDVEVTGRAAHAGMEPEKGISAIKAASHAISIMREGRIDPGTTVNVGIIEGGRIRNGVPEKAYVKAECRSLDHETCIAHSEIIKQTFETAARGIGAKAAVKMTLAYKASRIPEDVPVVTVARSAIEQLGMTPDIRVICGGTDASVFNAKGIQSVVLGIGAQAEHSNDEHIAVTDMEKAVQILHYVFSALCG